MFYRHFWVTETLTASFTVIGNRCAKFLKGGEMRNLKSFFFTGGCVIFWMLTSCKDHWRCSNSLWEDSCAAAFQAKWNTVHTASLSRDQNGGSNGKDSLGPETGSVWELGMFYCPEDVVLSCVLLAHMLISWFDEHCTPCYMNERKHIVLIYLFSKCHKVNSSELQHGSCAIWQIQRLTYPGM